MTAVRLFAAALALSMLAPAGAMAVDPSAQAMVSGIYKTYMGKAAKGIPINSPRVKALLTPGLHQLIAAELKRAAAQGDVPELNGDPFVDAQDFDFTSYDVTMVDLGPDHARALVTLIAANGVRRSPITLDLLKLQNGWRIDDIQGPSGSVRGYLTKK